MLQDKSSKSVLSPDQPSRPPRVGMGQAANRKGCAAMTRRTYCGNLLWQSGLTVLAPDRRSDEQLFEDFNGIVGVAAASDFRAWHGNSGAGDGWLL
jgi:hypothetical protein